MSLNHSHHHQSRVIVNRVFAVGIALNLAFVGIEGLYGWKANSLSLLADAGHNLSDVAGLIIAWAAVFVGRLKPDPRHTYGWQRASILAAFINAVILLLAMGALGWEAIQRLRAPAPIESTTMIVVAAIGILVNSLTAYLMRKDSSDLNIRGAYLHMMADAAVSAGVAAAGGLYMVFGWAWLDPVVSLLIAFIIVLGTGNLLRQSVHMLFDGVPDQIDPKAVRSYLESVEGVTEVHDLHIWAMSTSETALTAHLVIPGSRPGDSLLHELADTLHERFEIAHTTVQIESTRIVHACIQDTAH